MDITFVNILQSKNETSIFTIGANGYIMAQKGTLYTGYTLRVVSTYTRKSISQNVAS